MTKTTTLIEENSIVKEFPPRCRLTFGKIVFDDISAWEAPIERECFIEGLFPRGELVAIYGNPKDGKSHVITYMLYRASLGLPSFGREVLPCRVAYLALEGGNGFRNRVLALTRKFGSSAGFFPMRRPFNFLAEPDAVRDLITGLKALRADVLVIDTVTRAMPGADQNGQEAFSHFIGILDCIRAETGVCGVLVHHSGVSGRMMGSTVFPGALDVIARVEHDETTNVRTLKVEDARDEATGGEIAFRIENFPLGSSKKGQPISTGMVVEVEARITGDRCRRLSGMKELQHKCLVALFTDPGMVCGPLNVTPRGPCVAAIRRADVRRAFFEKGWLETPIDQPMTASDRDKLRKVLDALETAGVAAANRDWVWLR